MPDDNVQPGPQLTVRTIVMPGPDGQPWINLQIQYGLTMAAFMVHEEMADELGNAITKGLTESVAHIRRAKIGLILPGNGTPTPPLQMPTRPIHDHPQT